MSTTAHSPALRLRDFERIVFFTGAGLSAESGLPTYRGTGGVWHKYRWQEYACQRAFDANPEKVWDFHDARRGAVAACEPNHAHRIIAAVQREKPDTVVITQNIDGLLQRAGCKGVIELHGSLWRIRCDRDGIRQDNDEVPLSNRRCSCGGYWRPDIVWFEDALDPKSLRDAAAALSECEVMVSVGTSGAVFPAAELPRIALERPILSIEITLDETPISPLYTHVLRGKATEMLATLWE